MQGSHGKQAGNAPGSTSYDTRSRACCKRVTSAHRHESNAMLIAGPAGVALAAALVRLEISLQELDKPSFYRRDASGFAKRHINSTPKISRNFGVAFTDNQTA